MINSQKKIEMQIKHVNESIMQCIDRVIQILFYKPQLLEDYNFKSSRKKRNICYNIHYLCEKCTNKDKNLLIEAMDVLNEDYYLFIPHTNKRLRTHL